MKFQTVTDRQVRRLLEMKNKVDHLYQAADLAGMSVKTGLTPENCTIVN